ncbi:MAG: hypothetical protein K9M08_12700 [Pirellula sp.]|nr:hypothetical protein [Pirellula sp.]
MRAIIYLEGGGSGPNSKILDIRCERAFHKLLDRMGFTGRKPRLVACGGRDAVYKAFYTALRSTLNGYVAMWIDSEERHHVQQALETATKDCKNAYAKGKRSFEIFEKLDHAALRQHLPSFERVARILHSKL